MEKKKNSDLSHLDENGMPRMVDVGTKKESVRTAIAESTVLLGKEIVSLFKEDELHTKKGPVFQTAIIAGIMASKKTADLIPMCHPLSLDHCSVKIDVIDTEKVKIRAEVKTSGKTGVEMEALTACSVAALTVYDMCKSISKSIVILDTKLILKTGGKSDFSNL
jgi:cyclic pyranopterin phosphate synthase